MAQQTPAVVRLGGQRVTAGQSLTGVCSITQKNLTVEVTPKFNRAGKAIQGKPSHKNDTATLQCKSLAKYPVTSLKSNQDSLSNQLQATFLGIWGFCGVWG